MIDLLVSTLHRFGRYPLGLDWRLQFDNGRSYDRLKQICYLLARFEYVRVTMLDRIRKKLFNSLTSPNASLQHKIDRFVYPEIRQTRRWRTIRLLQLHSGHHDQPLVGTLTSFTMVTVYMWSWSFDKPQYEALSYCWGMGKPTETIILNGTPLKITPSLSVALQHLRLSEQDRFLWIDQICIDQQRVSEGDYLEKNHQVMRMGEIYTNAERTVVWFGEGDDASEVLFSALDRVDDSTAQNRSLYFLSEVQKDQPIYKSVIAEMSKIPTHAQFPRQLLAQRPSVPGGGAAEQELAWALFEEVLTSPWFERMWILQEGALAQDIVVQSGNHAISWRRFVGAMRILRTTGEVPRLPAKNVQSIEVIEVLRHTWYSLDGLSIDLTRMLEYSRPRNARDVRDKVYGLVGMYTPWSVPRMPASSESAIDPGSYECVAFSNYYAEHRPSGPSIPVVDYQRSVEQVYVDVALASLSSGRLNILKDCCAYEKIPPPGTEVNSMLHGHYISRNPSTKRLLPSWVPDWSIDAEGGCRSPLIDDLRTKEQPYSASKDSLAVARVMYEKDMDSTSEGVIQNAVLCLTGILFDEVTEVVSKVHTYESLWAPETRNIWAQWAQVALKDSASGPYHGKDGCIEALWRTLIADKHHGLDNERADSSLGQGFEKALYSAIIGGDLPPDSEARLTDSGRAYYVDHNTRSTSWEHPREGFITSEEYERQSKPLTDWLRACGDRHMERKLFRTRRGYIGMSCMHVRKGDKVAVLWGGRLPYILRQRAFLKVTDPKSGAILKLIELDPVFAGKNEIVTHELIGGECYIHGLAEGQALDVAEEQGLRASIMYLQ